MDIKHGDMFFSVSEVGATLTTFQWQDKHIIFQPQMVSVNGQLKLRGGIPIPCPWFGKGKKEGQPQHGFVRDTPMQRIDGLFHSMQMSWRGGEVGNPAHLFNGSFDFYASFKPRPEGIDGIELTVLVTRINRDSKGPMPLNMGFHPYFCLPNGEATIEFPTKTFNVHESDKGLVKSVVHNAPATPAQITIPGLGVVTMVVGGKLNSKKAATVIWSDQPQKYICVEPVLTAPDAYDTPNGFFLEKPGDQCEMSMILDFKPEN